MSPTTATQTTLVRLRQLQWRSLLFWSAAPLVSFLVMVIFRKQIYLDVRQLMTLLHGGDLKSKQNTAKLARFKKVLFESIKDLKSHDAQLRKEGKLLIAELNPSNGSNFEYYPRGSKVIAVEAEPVFEKVFAARQHEFPFANIKIERFLHARPEALEGIEDGSIDVVVGTLVCCSVDDLAVTMREIKRVLATGGRYYFLEHEQYQDPSWGYSIQKAVNPIWRACNDGCNVSRRVGEVIEYVGFRCVAMKKYHPAEIPYLMRPLIVGYATK
ncbi:methyltransferase protein 7A-like [Tropilaelaps mercedesae]|uniref:Methyltransferase protein 7A-like n=1 Tax=Tropilaelaps mercedesae TaxID=418985 RepID=A0A1V9XVA9_9ACAR|nr:methyltransferase protein 7A-like [Tropilaelaps mercedesae]